MVDPSLSFLPRYEGIDFVDCCNGLLLCRCWKMSEPHYVVCNPATYKMVVLPGTEGLMDAPLPTIRLGFDPAVSSHFRVFFLVRVTFRITGVEIYSSETGGWTFRQSEWGGNAMVSADPKSAFFNGTLYLTALDSLVVTVDTQGKTRRKIPAPHSFDFIGLSQGHLYSTHTNYDDNGSYQPSIWVLEDYGGQQ